MLPRAAIISKKQIYSGQWAAILRTVTRFGSAKCFKCNYVCHKREQVYSHIETSHPHDRLHQRDYTRQVSKCDGSNQSTNAEQDLFNFSFMTDDEYQVSTNDVSEKICSPKTSLIVQELTKMNSTFAMV